MPATHVPLNSPAPRMRRWCRTLSLLLLGGAAACGGGGDPSGGGPTPPTPTPGTLAVALGSTSVSLVAGDLVAVPVTITRGGSFSGAVTLEVSGAPSGVTAGFSASSLAAGVSTTTLNVQTTSATAAGTYPLTVRASGTGVTAATAQYALTVTTAPVPTFTLSAAPGAVSVVAGQQGTSTLTIARSGGFTGAVNLVAEGAPSGVTATLNPATVTGTSSTLTLAAGAATAPGTYPLTVRATGTGVAERTASVTLTVTEPPSVTLTSSASAVSIVQGQQSAPITITIARTVVTGPANFTVTSPTGITATLSPNPATGTTSALTIAVAPTVAPGQYPVSLQAAVAGAVGSLAVQVTVTSASAPDYGLSLSQSALSVTAGQSTSTTLNIARSGGFTGAVTLGTSALPAGATVTFTPPNATGATAQLSITTTAGTPAGTYAIIIFGNATGIAQRQVTLTLTVQGGGGGGSGNVVWQFCADNRIPIWFAYQDGTSGAWTRVLPGANNTYTFTLNQTLGGVTFVMADGGTDFDVTTFFVSRTELVARGQEECVNSPSTKTLTGTVAGLAPGQTATIGVGSGTGTAATNGPFTVTGVSDGVVDLLAARSATNLGTFTTEPDRFILRRNLNLPNNGAIPALDFAGAESFAPATASYTFANVAGGNLTVASGFFTANGGAGVFAFGPLLGGTDVRTIYGVPSARTQAGDLHFALANVINGGDSFRQLAAYNRELSNRTLTFGPQLAMPTVTTIASAPYRRVRATGSWQAEYNQEVGASFSQTAGGSRNWTVTVGSGYAAGATYTLEVPDLSGVAGFNTTWGLQAGAMTEWRVSASRFENSLTRLFVEDSRFVSAARTGNVP